MKKKTFLKSIIFLLISTIILSGCSPDANDQKEEDLVKVETEQNLNNSLEDFKGYLKEYFDVSFDEDIEKEDIDSGMKKIFAEETVSIEGDLNGLTFLRAINKASGFEELALSYDDEKVKESLKEAGIEEEVDSELGKYIACTIDTNLLDVEKVKELVSAEKITPELAITSLMQVINKTSLGSNYLGYSNDPTIYRKIEDSWTSFVLFEDEKLTDIGAKLVQDKKITGYNLKLNSYRADFIADKTMSYGHSNIEHALQLIGLLNSEDLVAKVQLEPKVSIYEYLPEWGPVGDPTPKYQVVEVADLLLANSVEYDLKLEFSSSQDLIEFERVIDKYAKKNEENEGEGLIVESWWQPFLLVSNDEMPEDLFFEIYDLSLSNEEYTLRSVVLKEDKDEIENEFKKLSDSGQVKAEKKYTNKAFYSYLTGTDYE